ncbi:hypothetical protein PS850_03577 [Pseudomonas fluorescens]|nr:hypothetical protein PS850_03577 [Pseudomonas fluorescens]
MAKITIKELESLTANAIAWRHFGVRLGLLPSLK